MSLLELGKELKFVKYVLSWSTKQNRNFNQKEVQLVMGPGSKFFDPGWISRLQFGFGKFPLKIPNYFPLGQIKISSGRVKKYPGQRWVGLLFTSSQKYLRVRTHL